MDTLNGWLAPSVLLVSGLIHVLPLAGLRGPGTLRALYGIDVSDDTLVLLLRHRAVLFGVLGSLMIAAAAQPSLHLVMTVASLVCAAGFVVLGPKGRNAQVRRVVHVDAALSGLLGLSLAVQVWCVILR